MPFISLLDLPTLTCREENCVKHFELDFECCCVVDVNICKKNANCCCCKYDVSMKCFPDVACRTGMRQLVILEITKRSNLSKHKEEIECKYKNSKGLVKQYAPLWKFVIVTHPPANVPTELKAANNLEIVVAKFDKRKPHMACP